MARATHRHPSRSKGSPDRRAYCDVGDHSELSMERTEPRSLLQILQSLSQGSAKLPRGSAMLCQRGNATVPFWNGSLRLHGKPGAERKPPSQPVARCRGRRAGQGFYCTAILIIRQALVPVGIRMGVAPIPVFRLLPTLQPGEGTILLAPLRQIRSVSAVLPVIPIVVITVVTVVVSFMISMVSVVVSIFLRCDVGPDCHR
jgi:hypothetical protein